VTRGGDKVVPLEDQVEEKHVDEGAEAEAYYAGADRA